MIHDLNARNVGTEPWSPEIFIPRPEPMAPQVPHPFCIVLLKGMQTRFYDSRAKFEEADRALGKKSRMGFEWLESCREYATVSEDGYLCVGFIPSNDGGRTAL